MVNWHRLRKRVHLICFLVFLALPFLNVMRFDIPRQRFYFLGYELWINEFGIIFLALMFLMFVVVVASVMFGRVYCGYLCPQMIFSEASKALELKLRRALKKRPALARPAFYLVLLAASVFLAFIFISYFVEPRDLARRLVSLDIRTAGGISGAVVTLLTFIDFTFVRLRFCATACPYGYLQGLLSDGNTLLVHYRDERRDCIECKKCVRDCPMGIDIRDGPFQIECVHCGECIDSCEMILAKLKKPGLIHYTWGETERRPRWRVPVDAKRAILLAMLGIYGLALSAALANRRDVLVRVAENRSRLFRVGGDGRVYNQFRYTFANRTHKPAMVVLLLQDLKGGSIELARNPVPVEAGQTARGDFEVVRPPVADGSSVTHFTLRAIALPEGLKDDFPMTFISPEEGR